MTAAAERHAAPGRKTVRIFLCGDVMTGRGIDQILPEPCPPRLYEGYVGSAVEYVELAEETHGAIPRPVDFSYIWGVTLEELRRAEPDLRIVNLETSITRSEDRLPKGINYRMSPENAECLRVAGIDGCALANNHVLDWGRAGLRETLSTLASLRIKAAGAGYNGAEARAPAIFEINGNRRVILFAIASISSGTPEHWAATDKTECVNVWAELSAATVAEIAKELERVRQPGDIVVVSIHWGPNWGYPVAPAERQFAHDLIDKAGVSIVHGHSSHHPKAIEVFKDRLILYGCGDFLNDYEGIRGYEDFRSDLSLMYFADVDPVSGDLAGLEMVPLQIRRFQLVRAATDDAAWLGQTLDRESRRFGTRVKLNPAGRLVLAWAEELPKSVHTATR